MPKSSDEPSELDPSEPDDYARDFAALRQAVKEELAENQRRAQQNQPTEEQLKAITF